MTHSSSNDYGQIMTVRQAAEELHGPNFTETDVNRLYHMIRRDQLEYVEMGRRRFLPTWQVDKLCKKKNFWDQQRVRAVHDEQSDIEAS